MVGTLETLKYIIISRGALEEEVGVHRDDKEVLVYKLTRMNVL